MRVDAKKVRLRAVLGLVVVSLVAAALAVSVGSAAELIAILIFVSWLALVLTGVVLRNAWSASSEKAVLPRVASISCGLVLGGVSAVTLLMAAASNTESSGGYLLEALTIVSIAISGLGGLVALVAGGALLASRSGRAAV